MSDPLAGIGFRILVPKPFKSEAEALFAQAGCNKISINQYELLRNERGLSGEPNELVEEYTPLEVSLHSAIAQIKGCHTGQ